MTPSATLNNKPSPNNAASSWIFTATLIGLILVVGLRDSAVDEHYLDLYATSGKFQNMLCDEIYVVREGETLHTISAKCGDPFIVERNPHIYDPDDVFPGLVIRIIPYYDGNE